MDRHIREILSNYVRKDKLGDGYFTQRIMKHWEEAMPNAITELTDRLDFKNGILTIFVNSAALKHELFNSRATVRDRCNEWLKDKIVNEVIIR